VTALIRYHLLSNYRFAPVSSSPGNKSDKRVGRAISVLYRCPHRRDDPGGGDDDEATAHHAPRRGPRAATATAACTLIRVPGDDSPGQADVPECGVMAAHLAWDQVHAGSIPASPTHDMALWRNWNTRRSQKPVLSKDAGSTPAGATRTIAHQALFGKSGSMGFVIQIVPGKAPARAVVLDVLGRAGNAARDDLGAKTAIRAFRTGPRVGG
jgi:hypothetical protein